MPQWSDKVIESGSDEMIRKAREADLFAEVSARIDRALTWVGRLRRSRIERLASYSVLFDDSIPIVFAKVYDELKALDEQLKKDRATPRTPQVSANEGTQTSDAEKLNPGTPPSCTGGCR